MGHVGGLATRQLHDAGFTVHGCRVGVVCDNAFGPHICRSLEKGVGWSADVESPMALPSGCFDAIVVAVKPEDGSAIGIEAFRQFVDQRGPVPLVQLWGDIDRTSLAQIRCRSGLPIHQRPVTWAYRSRRLAPRQSSAGRPAGCGQRKWSIEAALPQRRLTA